jgi:hypothetical protein
LFNPFTLSLEARGVELPEHSGERFLGLDKARVDFSLESLWHPGVVFDSVEIDQLYLHVRRLGAEEFNFSDLLPPEQAEPPADSEALSLPGITIRDLDFSAERIVISDEAREEPVSTYYEGLAIRVSDLSTEIEEGRPYRVDATAESGGTLHWEGHVSIPGAHSEGSLALEDISLLPFWRFLEPQLAFRLNQGRMRLDGNYQLSWQDGFGFAVSDGGLQLDALSITPKKPDALPDTALDLKQLSITGVSLDSAAQHATVQDVVIDQLQVFGWSEGSQVSLAQLFGAPTPASDPGPDPDPDQDQAEPPADPAAADDGWTAELQSIRLANSAAHWRSEFTSPPLLQVAPIDASLTSIRWPLAEDTLMQLALQINERAGLEVDGALNLASGDGTIKFALSELPVPWFNPNLPAALKAEITDGAITIAGQLALADFGPTTVSADGEIRDFLGKISGEEASLTSWDTVRWEQLLVNLDKRRIDLAKLSINNYSGRVHIFEDGSINTQNVWEQEVGDRAEEVREEINQEGPWSYSLPLISFTDSDIDFMDESLPLHFRTVIGDIKGEIKGLSSDAGTSAEVRINGSVDGYAPVKLLGSIEPFQEPPNLDLDLTFDGMDMATLTPYSGTYAGYAIDRGILNLDLRYALQEGKLDGKNEVLIQQLKLGEKIDSDKALDVPLKLGLALLTDLNGVIDLKVPVEGDLEDPEFRLGSVIMTAFVNLIAKAATAPFALLGGLVGSEEDLQRINFPSGSAELDEAGRSNLAQLSSALNQRPALTLVIMGRLQPEADREKLQEQTLAQQLLDGGLSPEQLDKKGGAWEKAVKKLYKARVAEGTVSAGEDKVSPLDAYTLLLKSVDVSDEQLSRLAEDRARAIKAFLVNEAQLPADRAVIEQVSAVDPAHIFSGVEMTIEV